MNIRSGPASVVSAEPILFPLPLWRLPRLQGFAVAPETGSLNVILHASPTRKVHLKIYLFKKKDKNTEKLIFFKFVKNLYVCRTIFCNKVS